MRSRRQQLALLLLGMYLILSSAVAQDYFQVKRGERPSIDLESIPDDGFEPGVVNIKFSRDFENHLAQNGINLDKDGKIIFEIPSIDQLNKEFEVVESKKLFESRALSSKFTKRHEAWGFHLWYTLYFDEATDVKAVVNAYQSLDEISVAEPEFRVQQIVSGSLNSIPKAGSNGSMEQLSWTPDDPSYDQQWHYHNTGQQSGTLDADIDLPEAWDIETGNSNVIVAIQDGGIQYDHPDLAGNMWSGIGYDFKNDDATIEADNHGSHVAGTVAAVNNNGVGVSGVAGGSGSNDGVRLMSCQVFDPGGSGGGFHLAPVYAADNGACISQNSWSYTTPGSYSQAVLDAIDYFNVNGGGSALSNGGISIYSAGNSNSTADYYPAYYSGTFSIAATNNQDKKSWYSNYGEWVDISAPGGETNSVTERGVLSCLAGDTYGFYQGTSMACPHASGVAALIASLSYGTLSADQVAEILLFTADDHYAVNPSYPQQLGSGRLNAYQALLETQYYMAGLQNPSNFTATPVSTSQINLSWSKNPADHDVLILWSPTETFGTPTNGTTYSVGQSIPGGGTVLYLGSNTAATHTGLSAETTYHYLAFSYNEETDYSSGSMTNVSTHCYSVSSLPWFEGFENVGPVSVFSNDVAYINGLCKWSYDAVNAGGRLRFNAGDDFYHFGTKAATLDRNPSGDVNTNYLIAELDLSEYQLSTDLSLSFFYMHHGEESNTNDRVWIRGSNADAWIEIYNLYDNQGIAGQWNSVQDMDIDALLAVAVPPQVPGTSFQLRFGQQDDFPASSTTGSDGYTFDDISITGNAVYNWTGVVSSDWDNAGNWINNQVPSAEAFVNIPASADNWPVKTGDMILGNTCRQLTMNGPSELRITGDLSIPDGVTFTVTGSGNIWVEGNWLQDGTFIPGNSTVFFDGNIDVAIDGPADVFSNNLETTFIAGNGSYGNMFDLIALSELTISGFDANLDVGSQNVSIYYKPGTWEGFDKNSSAWTFVGTSSVTSTGAGSPTAIPINVNVTIPAGERYAFYIHVENEAINYTNGSSVGNVYASDAHLQFLEGAGKGASLFGNPTFSPRIFNGIIYYDNYSTAGVTYNNLTIAKNNAIVQNNAYVTTTGNLTVNAGGWFTNSTNEIINVTGNVLFKADETGMASFIDEGTTNVTGTTSVEQYVVYNPPYQYHGVSSPINDATINTYLGMYLYEYDEANNNFNSLSTPLNLQLPAGRGFYVTGSDQYMGTATVIYETSTPTGKLNTEDIVLTGFTIDGPDPAFKGFHLIGNPYPSALDWNSNWNMTDMSGWMVMIDEGEYKGFHPTLGPLTEGGNGIIPSTQGFWVKALTSDASLTIPASERLHSAQSFYKDQPENIYPSVRLEVESSGFKDETVVVFHPEGNNGFDGYYDLTKFTNPEGTPQLFTVSEGYDFAFNVLQAEYDDAIVPVHFSIHQDGFYKINASLIENFPDHINVYLEDIKESTIIELKSNPEYNFSYNVLDNTHRFNLLFKDSNIGIDNSELNTIRIYAHDDRIYIQTPQNQSGWVHVYDLPGREILNSSLNESGTTVIPLTRSNGYYLVKVKTGGKLKTAKVFIQ